LFYGFISCFVLAARVEKRQRALFIPLELNGRMADENRIELEEWGFGFFDVRVSGWQAC